ncbi:TrkA C-terminal domain-containing protein [Streptomyces sp. NPDC003832]
MGRTRSRWSLLAIHPAQGLVLVFALTIVLGAGLLLLPAAGYGNHRADGAVHGDYVLIKTLAPKAVGGVPLGGSRVRSTYGVAVVGIKRPGVDFTHATAETVVHPGDVIVVTGRIREVETFAELEH